MSDIPELDLAILNACRQVAVGALNGTGHVEPFAIVAREEGHHIYVAPESFSSNADKRTFRLMVQALSVTHRATHVAFVAESWMTQDVEEWQRWRRGNPGATMSDFPGAVEVVFVALESFAGTSTVNLPIQRDLAGVPRIEGETGEPNFLTYEEAWSAHGGEMSHLLVPKIAWEDDRLVTAAREFMASRSTGFHEVDEEFLRRTRNGERPWEDDRVLQ